MSTPEDQTSPSRLSLHEFSTHYLNCPTSETPKLHTSSDTLSLSNLPTENPLQKELSQFLNLLQNSEQKKSNKTTSFPKESSKPKILKDTLNKVLPVIFSTEESGFCENNEFLKKIDMEIEKIERKIRRIKEKKPGLKEKEWENALLKEKIALLERKNTFLYGKKAENQTKKSDFELLEKILKDFTKDFEKIARDLRFFLMKILGF